MLDTCQQAINLYGRDTQLLKAVEALSDLSSLISKHMRGLVGDHAVVFKIADVLILCCQLQMLYGPLAVEKAVEIQFGKLQREMAHDKS